VNPDGLDQRSRCRNRSYHTAVALVALSAAKNPKYADAIANGRSFSRATDRRGRRLTKPDHRYYAEWLRRRRAADMSNLYLALEASGHRTDPKPVWQKALCS